MRILQLPSVGLPSRSRPDRPAFVINKACGSSATTNCGYRLLKISLAIYLVPALLVVLLVGAIGALFVGSVRLICRFFDSSFNQSRTPPDV